MKLILVTLDVLLAIALCVVGERPARHGTKPAPLRRQPRPLRHYYQPVEESPPRKGIYKP